MQTRRDDIVPLASQVLAAAERIEVCVFQSIRRARSSRIKLPARRIRNFGPPSEPVQWTEKKVLSGGHFITQSR